MGRWNGSGVAPRVRRRLRESSRLAFAQELVRLDRRSTALIAVTTLLEGLLPSASMFAAGALVGRVPALVDAGVDSAEMRGALGALIVVGVLSVSTPLVGLAGSLVSDDLARKASRLYDQEMMAAVAAPSTIAHLEDPEFLDRLEAASGQTRMGPVNAIALLRRVCTPLITAVVSLVVVAGVIPIVAALLAAHALASRDHNRRRYAAITTAIFEQGNLHRRSAYLRDVATTPAAAKEVRVFGLAGWLREELDGEWQQSMSDVWPKLWSGLRGSLGFAAVYVGIVTWGMLLLADATIDGRTSLSMAVTTLQAMLSIAALGSTGDSEYAFSEGCDRVPEHRSVRRRLHEAAHERLVGSTPMQPTTPARTIRFDQVSFAYPGTRRPVFTDFDLTIEAGSSVAIVGSNGAGKTTLVKLITGLHEPTTGRILVDDTPMTDLDPHAWQRRVAAIFQDFWHYPLSLRDNVGLGAPELIGDDTAVRRALARAGADELMARLPAGLDTVLDRQFEGGVDLSGGQWQRVALARALFAVEGGARVLVLDEPTAALDVRAEADVYDRFLDITRGLTTIVISHRFSTVRRADRIVVIEDGRVTEDGTHDELIALRGHYQKMFDLQAARFRDESKVARPRPERSP